MHARSVTFTTQVFMLAMTLAAGLALAVLVITTDPGPREERIFAALLFCFAGGLASSAVLMLNSRGSPFARVLRAFRRGGLFGLACSGAALLQINGAMSPTNLAFLLLVLLIVEMIFLARRQNVA